MKTNQSALHIGVDVGKQQLDFFCHESCQHFGVANTTAGINQAFRQLPLNLNVICKEMAPRSGWREKLWLGPRSDTLQGKK